MQKERIMNPICSISQAIKHFKGDLQRVREFCKQKGIIISDSALRARVRSL